MNKAQLLYNSLSLKTKVQHFNVEPELDLSSRTSHLFSLPTLISNKTGQSVAAHSYIYMMGDKPNSVISNYHRHAGDRVKYNSKPLKPNEIRKVHPEYTEDPIKAYDSLEDFVRQNDLLILNPLEMLEIQEAYYEAKRHELGDWKVKANRTELEKSINNLGTQIEKYTIVHPDKLAELFYINVPKKRDLRATDNALMPTTRLLRNVFGNIKMRAFCIGKSTYATIDTAFTHEPSTFNLNS